MILAETRSLRHDPAIGRGLAETRTHLSRSRGLILPGHLCRLGRAMFGFVGLRTRTQVHAHLRHHLWPHCAFASTARHAHHDMFWKPAAADSNTDHGTSPVDATKKCAVIWLCSSC